MNNSLEMVVISEDRSLLNSPNHADSSSEFHESSISEQSVNDQLVNALITNDSERVREYIRTFDWDLKHLKMGRIISHKYLWVFVCTNDSIEASTLEVFFTEWKTKYKTIKCFDESWYGWEPLHYVSSTANKKKLEALLKVLKGDVNSLTYFLENALHVLLQYEKSSQSFGLRLSNGKVSTKAAIIGIEKDKIRECAKMLIEHGIDVNQSNFWNETPIYLAIQFRYINLIDMLLTVHSMDLDSFVESTGTIREDPKWDILTSSLKSYVQENALRIRFNFLKSGDEFNFIHHNDSIGSIVNSLDNEDSCTMLQFCARKGFLEYLQHDSYKTSSSYDGYGLGVETYYYYDILDNPMLRVFKEKGLAKCVSFLLDNGADVLKTTLKFNETVLEFSSVRGYYPLVAILLYHKNSKYTSDDIFAILSKTAKKDITFMTKLKHCLYYRNCVLHLLLNKLISFYNKSNNVLAPTWLNNRNVLNKILNEMNLENVKTNVNDIEIILKVLYLGADLSYKKKDKYYNQYGKMIVERLEYSSLKSHFDDCIFCCYYKYDTLIRDDQNVYNECRVLNYLVQDKQKQQLLTHPLLMLFIRKKWDRIYKIFYTNLVFYTCLLVAIYAFTVCQYFGETNPYLFFFYCLLLALHMVKEIVLLLVLCSWRNILETSNILETLMIGFCISNLLLPNVYSAVGSILFSTFIFLIVLGQLPAFTEYTVIFSTIKYFFQYMAFYSVQFIAFSICFYLIFPFQSDMNRTAPNWGDVGKNLFFTLIYFTGEFSDRVLEPTNYPVFGRIIMTVFIICMTVILNNLLVGLIAFDMDEIKKIAKLNKQIKLASFIKNTNMLIKRIHSLRYLNCVTRFIRYYDLFSKGESKVIIYLDTCEIFDEETSEYIEKINARKNCKFNENILKKVYIEIFNEK